MNGLVVILAGPSGVGKDTICSLLLERYRNCGAVKTVSSTSREPRLGEVDGQHYHFLSHQEFEVRAARGEFLEYAKYGGNLYGTSRRMLEDLRAQSPLVFLVIELRGCRQIREMGIDPLICPITPENLTVLTNRIVARSAISDADMERRCIETGMEVAAIARREFGPPVINYEGHVEVAVDEIARRIDTRLR